MSLWPPTCVVGYLNGCWCSSLFQIATRSDFLGCLVNAAGDLTRMHEGLPQMGNVLEKNTLVATCDVVEQDEVRVKLRDVANGRDDRDCKLAAKQTPRDEFTDAGHTDGIYLDESGAFRLQIILENDAVRDVFP